jgi:hypothetical protein
MLRISLIDRCLPKTLMEDAATVNAKTVSKSGEVDWLNLPTKLTILQAYQKRSYFGIISAGRIDCSKSCSVLLQNRSRN